MQSCTGAASNKRLARPKSGSIEQHGLVLLEFAHHDPAQVIHGVSILDPRTSRGLRECAQFFKSHRHT